MAVHGVDGSDERLDENLVSAWGRLLQRVYEVELSTRFIDENTFHCECGH